MIFDVNRDHRSSTNSDSIWTWLDQSIIQEYRAILTVSTKFPKAGEPNYKVENFAELWPSGRRLLESVGEGNMEGGFWMYVTKLLINLLACTDSSFHMQVLWWSTRLTFNSPPIQRHLTPLSRAMWV